MALIQLPHRNRPWRVIVICILLNRARATVAEPIALELFRRWPTPEFLVEAPDDDLVALLRPLGFQHARANHLRLMSARWSVLGEPRTREEVLLLPGCGEYAADAWEIICKGRVEVDPSDRGLLLHVEIARAISKDTA